MSYHPPPEEPEQEPDGTEAIVWGFLGLVILIGIVAVIAKLARIFTP